MLIITTPRVYREESHQIREQTGNTTRNLRDCIGIKQPRPLLPSTFSSYFPLMLN